MGGGDEMPTMHSAKREFSRVHGTVRGRQGAVAMTEAIDLEML